MVEDVDIEDVAGVLLVSISLLARRVRQVQAGDELTLPERSALARLGRGGPATSSALARLEQISPQSMGVTLAGLEASGLVQRRPDPADGRRVILSVTESGRKVLRNRRTAKAAKLTKALSSEFTRMELEHLKAAVPLIERLAEAI